MRFLGSRLEARTVRRALTVAALAGGSTLAAAIGACGGDTLPTPDTDYDAGTRIRDAAGFDGDPLVGDSDLPETTSCTATPCVRAIGVGGEFACAVVDGGDVYCWGANYRAQVGQAEADGAFASEVPKPTKIALPGPARSVALGFFHGCALLEDDRVACWGYNDDSEVGLPPSNAEATPHVVTGLGTPVKQIVAGGYHTCAVLGSGAVSCWGYNLDGQLGSRDKDGGLSTTPTPTPVSQLSAIQDLAAGDRFTCALLADGGVSCFGDNSSGKLGRNTSDFSGHPDPAPVVGLAGPVSALGKSGGYHEHVVLADGRLEGWGTNTSGQIGTGASGSSVNQPTLVANLTGAAGVAAGNYFTCARMTDGTVQCWGANDKGQTGLAPEAGTTQLAPTPVRGISDAVAVESGLRDFTCALLAGGSVVCWGSNVDGQLGRGNVGGYDPNPAPVVF